MILVTIYGVISDFICVLICFCWSCYVKGVVHGVTGIVTQPVEGAKQAGVSGFFKG